MHFKNLNHAVLCATGATAMLIVGAVQAAGVPGQGTWETTLLGRDISGHAVAADSDSAVFLYDTTLDITWLRDANYAGTSGYASDGFMVWDTADTWANTLTVGSYSGWRLPTMIDTGPVGCDDTFGGTTDCGYNVQTKSGDPTKHETGQTIYSEMAHLFYITLGNKAYCMPNEASPQSCVVQPGWGLTNTGNFQNFQSYYWSGLVYAPLPDFAWNFGMYSGGQSYGYKGWDGLSALAVRSGDVALVPEPQTYALLLLGLGGLALARRRSH